MLNRVKSGINWLKSSDLAGCRHDFALGVLLLEDAPRHGGVGSLNDGSLSNGISGCCENIADFECSHGGVG